MRTSRLRHLPILVLAVVLQLFASAPAHAGRWVYAGPYKSDTFADSSVQTMEIRITANPGDKIYAAQVFLDGELVDEGMYYPSTRRLRTKRWDGDWDPERKAFCIKSAGEDNILVS